MDKDFNAFINKQVKNSESFKIRLRRFKLFLLGLGIYAAILIIGLLLMYFMDMEWLEEPLDYISIIPCLLSLWFCSVTAFEYYKQSLEDEAEQNESRHRLAAEEEELEKTYRELGLPFYSDLDYPWFNHKKSRLKILFMFSALIFINLGIMTWTILGW
ncbi:hypothetical protein [Peribacillus frigoritolerans]|uniref:Uncharacterized protein n=1 Tax=Peribacillus castrilensis TaxID=2897690 RepID=A0AAW9NQ97_9BACI|nr:hypothetical protein [Peribacillus castrilensis]